MSDSGGQSSEFGAEARLIVPVILCGGTGTRLWPLSRSNYPKQFIKGLDGSDLSPFGTTLRRINSMAGCDRPVILTNDEYRLLCESELSDAGITEVEMVLEPVSRDTAPAIAVAALLALRRSSNAFLLVMPSDLTINKNEKFSEGVSSAVGLASSGRHVIFGVETTSTYTNHGYVRLGRAHEDYQAAFHVESAFDAPGTDSPHRHIGSSGFVGNSGACLLSAQAVLSELRHFSPQIVASAEASLAGAGVNGGSIWLDREHFSAAPSISIGRALLENTKTASVMLFDMGWSDISSWSSLHEFCERDAWGNSASQNVILDEAQNCFVVSTEKLVATLGTKDLIVVDTPDALLVADKSRSHDIGGFVAHLKDEGRKEQAENLQMYREKGYFEAVNLGSDLKIRRLVVKPGAEIGTQMHNCDVKLWIVVGGVAKVTIGDINQIVTENQHIGIGAGTWHALKNTGSVPLELIEVQRGRICEEVTLPI